MLKDTMEQALNAQIQKELYSSYLYLAMSAQLEADNLQGFAKWMRLQADEEREHAMKIYDYVNDRGGRVVLQAIEEPPKEFGDPPKIFQTVLEHERKVTASINQLYELALKEKDYPSQSFLTWFINEQVEEERSAEEVVDHLQKLENKMHALLILDRRMGKRK